MSLTSLRIEGMGTLVGALLLLELLRLMLISTTFGRAFERELVEFGREELKVLIGGILEVVSHLLIGSGAVVEVC